MSDLDRYDYKLPKELIAQRPEDRRSDARLLVVDRRHGSLIHAHVRDLPDMLDEGDCLVLNDTRVVPARLVGYRSLTGGHWEGLFINEAGDGIWQLLCRTRGKLRSGETVTLVNRFGRDDVQMRLLTRDDRGVWLVQPLSDEPALELLERVGRIPLPRYIRGGEMYEQDRERYQTVYARHPGSVAAPTAGLHFTDELLVRLIDRGVTPCRVTLHVGLGTFRPIETPMLADHKMHAERCRLEADVAERLEACRRAGGRIVAVGTTSVRTLETAAASGTIQPYCGTTDLFIRPGYQFRAVDALLTNFHLPRSTLLVLVSTLAGEALVRRAYQEAIAQRYRFYSYGDAMLIV